MKNYILTYILLALGFITSCSDTDSNTLPGSVTDNLKEGFTYLPETPDADQPLTITFKASPTSALYGYAGDVYLHTGIVSEGVWLYVPADWNENIEKCKNEGVHFVDPKMAEGKAKFPDIENIVLESLRLINLNKADKE